MIPGRLRTALLTATLLVAASAWPAPPEPSPAPAADVRSRIGTLDLDSVQWPEKHRFRTCYEIRFLRQQSARTRGKPSSWISNHDVIFDQPIDQTFMACLPTPGVSGSALYTGANWIFLNRNSGNQLHGDVVGADRKRTRFIVSLFTVSGDTGWLLTDYYPDEVSARMHIVLDADRKPEPGKANMLVLFGEARKVPIPGVPQ